MTFGERLTELRKENGYNTRNEFAEKLGIPNTTLRNYETNVREPGHTFLKQISELFNVSVDYLLCLTDDKEVLNNFRLRSSEQEIVEKYRSLDDIGKQLVNYVIDIEVKRSNDLIEAEEAAKKRILTYEKALRKMQGNKSQSSMVAEAHISYGVNAAHEDNPTEEQKIHADNVMTDDSEWE